MPPRGGVWCEKDMKGQRVHVFCLPHHVGELVHSPTPITALQGFATSTPLTGVWCRCRTKHERILVEPLGHTVCASSGRLVFVALDCPL